MVQQPSEKPLTPDAINPNRSSARSIPEHTVARGHLETDEVFYNGTTNGKLVVTLPIPLTKATLQHGREQFEIYCAVCHGPAGDGDGMIVQRGFPRPPSYHEQRLRDAPVGHFYDVIKNGYGVMYPQAPRVAPENRWPIVAYIRALQLSRQVSISDLPPAEQVKLEATKAQ